MLDASIDPATQRWRAACALGSAFEVGGDRVAVKDYHLEEAGSVVAFRLAAYRGGLMQRIESRYRIPVSGWPGPVWVDAPYGVAKIDKKATINGNDRSVYFDATRFEAFRLGTVLQLSDLDKDLGSDFGQTRGNRASLQVVPTMDAVRERYGTPTLIEVVGRALNSFTTGDTRLNGGNGRLRPPLLRLLPGDLDDCGAHRPRHRRPHH